MEINEERIIEDVNEEYALACLLASGQLFLNNVDLSEIYKFYPPKTFTTVVYVNSSDVFMWGCADGECISYSDGDSPSEIINLYKLWKDNNKWGTIKWLCLKRNMQPQFPIKKDMIKDNYWGSDMEDLPKNPSEK